MSENPYDEKRDKENALAKSMFASALRKNPILGVEWAVSALDPEKVAQALDACEAQGMIPNLNRVYAIVDGSEVSPKQVTLHPQWAVLDVKRLLYMVINRTVYGGRQPVSEKDFIQVYDLLVSRGMSPSRWEAPLGDPAGNPENRIGRTMVRDLWLYAYFNDYFEIAERYRPAKVTPAEHPEYATLLAYWLRRIRVRSSSSDSVLFETASPRSFGMLHMDKKAELIDEGFSGEWFDATMAAKGAAFFDKRFWKFWLTLSHAARMKIWAALIAPDPETGHQPIHAMIVAASENAHVDGDDSTGDTPEETFRDLVSLLHAAQSDIQASKTRKLSLSRWRKAWTQADVSGDSSETLWRDAGFPKFSWHGLSKGVDPVGHIVSKFGPGIQEAYA